MASRSVSLKQVAKEANVSIATVSYVLTGKGRMSPDTRREIEKRLRDAGIKPKYKRRPIFFLVDHKVVGDEASAFQFFQAYDGLNSSFHIADLTLRIEFVYLDGSVSLQAQLDELLSYGPGAVILDSGMRQHTEAIGRFFEKHYIPAIQIGHITHCDFIDGVVVDNFAGAYKAVQHFVAAGHRKIATIRWQTTADPASPKKHAGYICALREAGIPVRDDYVVESPFTRVDDLHPGRFAAEQLLALPDPPTAVFVENSFISPSLIHTIGPCEQNVPAAIRGLDIIHFEALHMEWIERAMRGVLGFPPRQAKLLRINWQELGRVAADRLLARLSGTNTGRELIQLVPKLYQVNGFEYASLEP